MSLKRIKHVTSRLISSLVFVSGFLRDIDLDLFLSCCSHSCILGLIAALCPLFHVTVRPLNEDHTFNEGEYLFVSLSELCRFADLSIRLWSYFWCSKRRLVL